LDGLKKIAVKKIWGRDVKKPGTVRAGTNTKLDVTNGEFARV
jgi:hypothetical protein